VNFQPPSNPPANPVPTPFQRGVFSNPYNPGGWNTPRAGNRGGQPLQRNRETIWALKGPIT
jgi:hypothetical protein